MISFSTKPRAIALRLTAALALLGLCGGFEWPGRLTRLIYSAAHASPAERREAVRLLTQYPIDAVRDPLLLALEDTELDVRLEAANALGLARAREAVVPLMDWLDDKNSELRAVAVRALGSIDDARSRPGLARALADGVPEVRLAAVAALGQSDPTTDAETLPALLASLDDPDASVRRSVAQVLAERASAGSLAPLANRARDESAEVRAAVLRALGRLRDARALPLLLQALSDGDESVRLAAIAALGDSNNPAAIAALRTSLTGPARAARTAVAALGRIDDDRAQSALIDCLSQPELGPPAANALVERARSNAGRMNLQPSAAAAARANGPQPLTALVNALGSTSSPAVAALIADTLLELSEFSSIASAVPALRAALAEGRGDGRSLVRALAASGAPELLPVLLERLAQAEESELTTLVDALTSYFEQGLGDGRASEPLLARLSTSRGPLRPKLLRLIGLSRAARALPALIELLPRADAVEARAIVEAIGELPVDARKVLWPLLEARDRDLKLAAARALAGSADPALVRELAAAIRGASDDEREPLVLALSSSLERLARARPPSVSPPPSAAGSEAVAAPIPGLDQRSRDELLGLLAKLSASPDAALAGRALDALRNLGDRRAVPLIARLLRASSPQRRAAAMLALGDFPDDETRKLLRFVLQNDTTRVGAAAALALAEVGDQRDALALLRAAQRGIWPGPQAASFGLVRLAQRGVIRKHSMQRLLCELAVSSDPYIRANVAAGMAALQGPACDAQHSPAAWLDPAEPEALRVAAAHWARSLAVAEAGREPALAQALSVCSSDRAGRLAQICAGKPLPAAVRARLALHAYESNGQVPLRDRLITLRLPDASVYIGYSDSNGELTLPAAASGEIVLEDPALPL